MDMKAALPVGKQLHVHIKYQFGWYYRWIFLRTEL